jgi:pimeloyl-ACP methyl ester carboxylesterase
MNATGPQPAERHMHIRLRDGRRLVWYEWGRPSDYPVLFCTGAAMSGSLGFGAAHLGDLGLRLIAFDRPGLGWSDPDSGKTLLSWAEDIGLVSAVQGLRGAAAVGFSQGAPFALALAARVLIEALALVSGQDELSHPSLAPLLHPDVARVIATIAEDAPRFERHFSQMTTAETAGARHQHEFCARSSFLFERRVQRRVPALPDGRTLARRRGLRARSG